MLKAVEISQYGVLEAGGKEYMDKQREIYAHLCNNDGPWEGPRHSDTRHLDPYIPELKKQSHELIRLVKTTLAELSPAGEILRKLADKPLAFRRIEGKTWKQIEAELLPRVKDLGRTEHVLLRIIGLSAIYECDSEQEWLEAATHQLATEQGVQDKEESVKALRDTVQSFIAEQKARRNIYWSKEAGSFLNNQ
jgi:hypothetical protein